MTEVQEKQRQNIKFGYILSNTETVWILQWKSTVRGKLSFFEEEQCREDFASEFLHRGKNLQKTSIIKNQNYKQSSMSCKRVNQTVVERKIFEPHDLKDWVRLLRQEALPFILNTTISLIRSTLIEQPAHDIFQKKTVAYQEREHLPFHWSPQDARILQK